MTGQTPDPIEEFVASLRREALEVNDNQREALRVALLGRCVEHWDDGQRFYEIAEGEVLAAVDEALFPADDPDFTQTPIQVPADEVPLWSQRAT